MLSIRNDSSKNNQSANIEAYLSDLKYLLENHYGEYAVYINGEKVAIEKCAVTAQYYVHEHGLEKQNKPILINQIRPLNEQEVKELRSPRVVKELRWIRL